jgi:hypothetical protein
MYPQIINQEILLFTGTSFARREFCCKENGSKEGKFISTHEKLEKACWDGLLVELLPEVAKVPGSKEENFIWQIIAADNFLCINIGAYDEPVVGESSIDPYWFITSQNIN